MTYKEKLQKIITRYESGEWDEAHFLYNMAWLYSQGGNEDAAKALQSKANGIFKDYANNMVTNLMTKWHKFVNEDVVAHVESYLWGQLTAYDFVNDCVRVWQISPRKDDQIFAEGRKIDLSYKLSNLTEAAYKTAKIKLAAIEA